MRKYEVISFHPGRQHNFEQAAQLSRFYKSYKHLTSLFFSQKTVDTWRGISSKVSKYLKKRSFKIDKDVVETFATPEIKHLPMPALIFAAAIDIVSSPDAQ